MTVKSNSSSVVTDHKQKKRRAQVVNDEFAARLVEAMGSIKAPELATKIGVDKSAIYSNLEGSIPSADRAFAMADTLGVSPRWFATGVGPMRGMEVPPLDPTRWVLLPLYDLAAFDRREASGQIVFPPVLEMVPVRRADLARLHITRSEVWLIEMPTNILPSVAPQGELLVCQDSGAVFHDRKVIIFAFGGDPSIIRRVVRASDGKLTLQADDPSVPAITIDQLAGGFARFGEVMGAIRTLPAA